METCVALVHHLPTRRLYMVVLQKQSPLEPVRTVNLDAMRKLLNLFRVRCDWCYRPPSVEAESPRRDDRTYATYGFRWPSDAGLTLAPVRDPLAHHIETHAAERQMWEDGVLDGVLENCPKPLGLVYRCGVTSTRLHLFLFAEMCEVDDEMYDEPTVVCYYVVMPAACDPLSATTALQTAMLTAFAGLLPAGDGGRMARLTRTARLTLEQVKIANSSLEPTMTVASATASPAMADGKRPRPSGSAELTAVPGTYRARVTEDPTDVASLVLTRGGAAPDASHADHLSAVMLDLLATATEYTELHTLRFSVEAVFDLTDTDRKHFLALLEGAPALTTVEIDDASEHGKTREKVFTALQRRLQNPNLPALDALRLRMVHYRHRDEPARRFVYRRSERLPALRELVVPFAVLFDGERRAQDVVARRLGLGRVDRLSERDAAALFLNVLPDRRTRLIGLKSSAPGRGRWPVCPERKAVAVAMTYNVGRHFHVRLRRLDEPEGLRSIVAGCARLTLVLMPIADEWERVCADVAALLATLVPESDAVAVLIHGGCLFGTPAPTSAREVRKRIRAMGNLLAEHVPGDALDRLHVAFDVAALAETKTWQAFEDDGKRAFRGQRGWMTTHVTEIRTSPDAERRAFLRWPVDLPLAWPDRSLYEYNV